MSPGEMQFTKMSGAPILASDLVKQIMPALLAE
jgi:hypothetical protein